jgi:transposase
VRALFASLSDSTGVLAHRRVAFEQVGLLLGDWQQTRHRLAATETRMRGVLEELRLTDLVTSITGLSALGAAAILAETRDLNRFASARAVVKHAGLAPREKLFGNFTGRTKLSGQGRPGLRWLHGGRSGAPNMPTRFMPPANQHLTSRPENKLTATQAQSMIAAAILRQLHAVVTTGRRWDPQIAAHGTRRLNETATAA